MAILLTPESEHDGYLPGLMAAPAAPPKPPRRPLPPVSPEAKGFHQLIDAMLALNARLRAEHAHEYHRIPADRFAEEHATVRASLGRRAGASSYIRERATENDLVIVPSIKMRDIDYGIYRLPCRIETPDLRRNVHAGSRTRYDKIYIDCPSFVFSQIHQDELYYKLAYDHAQTFILLGM